MQLFQGSSKVKYKFFQTTFHKKRYFIQTTITYKCQFFVKFSISKNTDEKAEFLMQFKPGESTYLMILVQRPDTSASHFPKAPERYIFDS